MYLLRSPSLRNTRKGECYCLQRKDSSISICRMHIEISVFGRAYAVLYYRKAMKLEEAADLYIRAANAYKVAKRTKGNVCVHGRVHGRVTLWCTRHCSCWERLQEGR